MEAGAAMAAPDADPSKDPAASQAINDRFMRNTPSSNADLTDAGPTAQIVKAFL
jgi:hypothetical protein